MDKGTDEKEKHFWEIGVKDFIYSKNQIFFIMKNEQMKTISVILTIAIIVSIVGTIALISFDAKIYKRTTLNRKTADGINVFLDIYEPVSDSSNQFLFENPRPAVIAVHGFGVSKEFFAHYGMEFARLGIVTVCIELRSMGRSEGDFFNGEYKEWLKNVDLKRELTEQFPDISVFQNEVNLAFELLESREDINMSAIALIGHSTGGGVVLQTGLFHPDKIKATVGIAALPIEGINATSHRNLMLILGGFDEAFSFERTINLFRQSTGDPISIQNMKYGNFVDGSARMFMHTPYDDHMTETFNPIIMEASVNWIVSSLKGQEMFVDETTAIYINRVLLIAVSAIGALISIILIGMIALDKMSQKQNWTRKRKLTTHYKELEKIPIVKLIVTIIGINILCFPITLGFFYLILLMGMTVASFILPFAFNFAISIMIYSKILSKKGIISGKQMIEEYCIPNAAELIFGIVSGILILMVFQSFFGTYFVSLLLPVHKIAAAVPLIIGTAIFLIANEFWSRLFIQNRWERENFTIAGVIEFIKSKLGSTILSSTTLWISMVLGILVFQQIIFTNFIWMIIILIFPLLIFINFISAVWYPYARRIPPIALAFVITIVSALIAMSTYVNVWA